MSEPTTMSIKGQVTIPRDVRGRLGLQAGDKIAWSLLSNGTVVVRPNTRPMADLVGMLTRPGQPGVTVDEASASGEPPLITLCALLETERALRSRYKIDRASMTAAVIVMLETPGIEFEQAPTVEVALYLFEQVPSANFADCLLLARATHPGRDRFMTFDACAAKLPRAELGQ